MKKNILFIVLVILIYLEKIKIKFEQSCNKPIKNVLKKNKLNCF